MLTAGHEIRDAGPVQTNCSVRLASCGIPEDGLLLLDEGDVGGDQLGRAAGQLARGLLHLPTLGLRAARAHGEALVQLKANKEIVNAR